MSDTVSLMHSAFVDYQETERESKLPKKPEVKAEVKINPMWQDLAVLEEQNAKNEKNEPKEVPKQTQPIKEKEEEPVLNTSFDDTDLSMYGAELGE